MTLAAVDRLSVPPLLSAVPLPAEADPFRQACANASQAQPGTLYYAREPDAARAALVLAPEMALGEAIGVLFAAKLGLSDAIGALGPAEVAVHMRWPDRIAVNGAPCATLRAAASHCEPAGEPDWLVTAIDVPLSAAGSSATALHEEGCGAITAAALIESWSRHTLVWIHRFLADGFAPLNAAWSAKCDQLGKPVTHPREGTFVGLDERGGMRLRHEGGTALVPLTTVLDPA